MKTLPHVMILSLAAAMLPPMGPRGANAFYNNGRKNFLGGDIDWDANDIKVVLLTSSYTFDQAHEYLADIAGGAIVATSGNLASKTKTDGVADADDVTFSAVTGSAVASFVVYQDTGSSATSRLICYVDTCTGLPVTPNGGDITLQWDSGANKIFKL